VVWGQPVVKVEQLWKSLFWWSSSCEGQAIVEGQAVCRVKQLWGSSSCGYQELVGVKQLWGSISCGGQAVAASE
jgi:hypothetical protein